MGILYLRAKSCGEGKAERCGILSKYTLHTVLNTLIQLHLIAEWITLLGGGEWLVMHVQLPPICQEPSRMWNQFLKYSKWLDEDKISACKSNFIFFSCLQRKLWGIRTCFLLGLIKFWCLCQLNYCNKDFKRNQ